MHKFIQNNSYKPKPDSSFQGDLQRNNLLDKVQIFTRRSDPEIKNCFSLKQGNTSSNRPVIRHFIAKILHRQYIVKGLFYKMDIQIK